MALLSSWYHQPVGKRHWNGRKSCLDWRFRKSHSGTSLVVQWVRLHASSAGGPGSISGRGTRSHMHAATKSLHAATKDPACHNEDSVLQLRPGAA